MGQAIPLTEEYRGDLLDLTHFGHIAVVDETGRVIYSAGDPSAVIFYRSASKPVQALPVFAHGLKEKYGITDEESVIFAASHAGEPFHVAGAGIDLQKSRAFRGSAHHESGCAGLWPRQ